MKLSAVYKSPRKADTYLYVEKRDDFSTVPDALMQQFGTPSFVMLIPLTKRGIIAGINTVKLIEKITADGFYLQLPPKTDDLLVGHLATQQHDARNNQK